MEKAVSRVTSKGQIVIPKKLREKYDIAPATRIRWIPKEDGLLLVPEIEDAIQAARGMLQGTGLLKAYRKEKKLEKQREAKKFGERI